MIEIKWEAIHSLVRLKAESERMSLDDLSVRLGYESKSCFLTVLSRLEEGCAIDAVSFVAILEWLDVSYAPFIKPPMGDDERLDVIERKGLVAMTMNDKMWLTSKLRDAWRELIEA